MQNKSSSVVRSVNSFETLKAACEQSRAVLRDYVHGKTPEMCATKNNRADNLLWGTYKDNEDDKREHGIWYSRISNASLCPESVRSIRESAKAGISQIELARSFNVSRPTITRVVNGSIWRHVA